jgi:hypothetical protein
MVGTGTGLDTRMHPTTVCVFTGEERPLTDEQRCAAWEPTTQLTPYSWRDNPLLDLPLKSYAGMNKDRVWTMFVD